MKTLFLSLLLFISVNAQSELLGLFGGGELGWGWL